MIPSKGVTVRIGNEVLDGFAYDLVKLDDVGRESRADRVDQGLAHARAIGCWAEVCMVQHAQAMWWWRSP